MTDRDATAVDARPATDPVGSGDHEASPGRGFDDPARFWTWLGVITAVTLIWRIVYVLVWRGTADDLIGDAEFYHYSAHYITDGRGWINPFHDMNSGVVEESADHPPLYLAYLVLWTLAGVDSIAGHMIVSTFVGTAAVVMIALAGRRLVGPRVGLLAALIASIYPNVWSHDGMLLSETAAIATVAAFCWAAAVYIDRATLGRAIALGAVVGFAALARSELLLFSVIAVTPLALSPRVGPWLVRIRHLVAAGVACVVVLLPWVVHNLMRFEEPVLLSVGFEITLATANCDDTYYGPNIGYWSFDCALRPLEEAGATVFNADQVERSAIFWDAATTYVDNHTRRVPVVVAARLGRVTGLYKPVQHVDFDSFIDRRDRWVAWSSMVMWYPVAVGAIAGVVVLRRRGIPAYPFAAPMVVVLVTTVITFGQNRYRASAEIALCLLAAVAVDAALRRWRDRRPSDDPASSDARPDEVRPGGDGTPAAPRSVSATSPGSDPG